LEDVKGKIPDCWAEREDAAPSQAPMVIRVFFGACWLEEGIEKQIAAKRQCFYGGRTGGVAQQGSCLAGAFGTGIPLSHNGHSAMHGGASAVAGLIKAQAS